MIKISRTNKLHRQHGFTMVELVLVLIITGLLATVALPRFFNPAGFENRGFYTEVLNAVRYAQQLAIAINCNTQVAIAANSYIVTIDDDPVNCNGPNFNTPAPHPVTGGLGFENLATVLPITVVPPAEATFVFTPLGQLNPGTPNITITTGGLSFLINSTTGYIQELQAPL